MLVYHTIIRTAFVCVFVCSLSPPRSFGRSSPDLVGVCRGTSHLPLRGSFSKRSTARQVNKSLSLSSILYMRQPHTTRCKRLLLLCWLCCSRPVARLFCVGSQIGQIWGPFMITCGLSCDRVKFGHFGGGSDDPPDPPLATGLCRV